MASDITHRRALLASLLASGLAGPAAAQNAGQILEGLARDALARQLGTAPATTATNSGLPAGVSTQEADGGIREALSNGVASSILRLGKADGYWGDGIVRIPLPKPLDEVQRILRVTRQTGVLDDLHLKINRAAETAAPQTRTIFADAIRGFTITDVVQVLRGGDTAGTALLKQKTQPQLVELYSPTMLTAVNQSGAGPAFDRVSGRYRSQIERLGGYSELLGLGGASGDRTSMKASFVKFATTKALDGLFHYVGEEEREIRRNPARRVGGLLQRVFGGL